MMITKLSTRSLLTLTGEDASKFLQDIVTNDMALLEQGNGIIYTCLLTPQGMFLHDMFISKHEGGFLLECEAERKADLLKRLRFLKLRAKVDIQDVSEQLLVYVSDVEQANLISLKDPRTETFPLYRIYAEQVEGELSPESEYHDLRIEKGVPEGSADVTPSKDVLANVNIDCLHAIAYTKGCYVGQEVTNRIKNRGLVKRRLVIISGEGLHTGDLVYRLGDRRESGVVRSVNSNKNKGLAIIKIDILQGNSSAEVELEPGNIATVCVPEYID